MKLSQFQRLSRHDVQYLLWVNQIKLVSQKTTLERLADMIYERMVYKHENQK